ncbi:hypothetical protein J2Z76_000813 [Sedimentibacter acidaminivorans]|uniref:CBM-cenC domain-containing protein n=1 Tax=Sedimentibacter acidaminivorans TaxID=913099 RepID=A0ABS4GB88_9FIRM|nr:hypothetical protein [Sedimentibacter acidaminivorans]MBP1924956.1 hypothetical protein [Sedimentibacter acidaminivorans]
MNNNYKIIRTIFENVFQRVLECKDNVTGEIFYNNVITSQKIIKLIDIDGLKNLNSNILSCYRTEDRIFIVTKSFDTMESEVRNVKDYVSSKKLSLKQQFYISKKIIELSSNIFSLTDVVQQKILDLNKIYIDNNDDVIVDCNLIFEQEYDIQDNETFKRMGNVLHYIFSGTEIVDYNISELVPPDMLKIIVRCLTKEYMYPKDALKELNNSPIYNMINPNSNMEDKINDNVVQSVKVDKHQDILEETITESDETDYNLYDGEKNDDSVLEIYLDDSNNGSKLENKKTKNIDTKKGLFYYLNNKDIKRLAISLVIIVFVLMLGNYLIKNYGKDSENVSGKNTDVVQNEGNSNSSNNNDNDPNKNGEGNVEDSSDSNTVTDSTSIYFNKELLESVGYTGILAEIDEDIYVEGNKSLVVKNDGDEKVKALFATIDFTDPEYNYMLKKQIAIAAKTKSEKDVSSLIVLEAFKDGKLASTFHTTVQIYNDMWSQNTVPINVTNADSLNIYIEFSGKNKVWIDSIYIDVVK